MELTVVPTKWYNDSALGWLQNVTEFHETYNTHRQIRTEAKRRLSKMANAQPEESLVSFIGEALFRPVADLCHSLKQRESNGKERAFSKEFDYSNAIILLTVAAIESVLNRTQFVRLKRQGQTPTPDQFEWIAWKFFDTLWREELEATPFPDKDMPLLRVSRRDELLSLKEDLVEVYVVRDAIIHNHLWQASVPESSAFEVFYGQPIEVSIDYEHISGGDRKFRDVVDMTSQRSKQLDLNVNPIRLDRCDVVKVLRVADRLFDQLQRWNYWPPEVPYVPWEGDLRQFSEFVEDLERRWSCAPQGADIER